LKLKLLKSDAVCEASEPRGVILRTLNEMKGTKDL